MAEDLVTGREKNQSSEQTAVTFISHICHEYALDRFEKLTDEALPEHDVYFLFDSTDATPEDIERVRALAGEQLRTFTRPEVTTVPYPNPWTYSGQQELIPGNLDLAYLHFSRIEPDYSRYWFIEYDVAYTGSWSEFFRAFESSTADLLASQVEPYENKPDWIWWASLNPAPDIDRSEWLSGFFPVVRLSQEMLDLLDNGYQAGWSGHQEVVLPTLASYDGLEIEDFGGDGTYVKSGNTNRFYTDGSGLLPSTFVAWPPRPQPGRRSGMLWHPVKPDQVPSWWYVRLLKRWVNTRIIHRVI